MRKAQEWYFREFNSQAVGRELLLATAGVGEVCRAIGPVKRLLTADPRSAGRETQALAAGGDVPGAASAATRSLAADVAQTPALGPAPQLRGLVLLGAVGGGKSETSLPDVDAAGTGEERKVEPERIVDAVKAMRANTLKAAVKSDRETARETARTSAACAVAEGVGFPNVLDASAAPSGNPPDPAAAAREAAAQKVAPGLASGRENAPQCSRGGPRARGSFCFGREQRRASCQPQPA